MPSCIIPSVPYWRLSSYYFFYFAFIGAFSPYFGLFLQGKGFSAWEIALLLSQMQLMRVAAPVIWGWLADKTGRRRAVVRLAGLASGLSFGGFFLVDSFTGWWLAIGLLAFFWGAALPLVEAITMAHLQEDSAAYSRIRLWGSVGFVLTVILTGWWLERAAMDSLLFILFILLLGIWACALFIPESASCGVKALKGSLRQALRQSRVRALLLGCFVMSVAHGALYIFYSIFLAAQGYSSTVIGFLWSLGVFAEIAVFMLMASLLRRFSVRSILLACFIAAALRFVLIGCYVDSLFILLLAQLLHGLTFGAYHAAAIHAVNHWFPTDCQGRGQALYSSLSFGAGGLIGGVLSGAAWESLGGAWVFVLSGGVAVLGGLIIWRWAPENKELS